MKHLRQLSPQETLFIGGETSSVYQHTGGLVLLDGSDRPDFGFETFRRYLQERLANVPQFRWKLHEVPLGLDLPYWVEDEDFSYDRHIRRIAVPSPGGPEELGQLTSYLYSRHLDRHRPLWETWFVEGLPGGQFALIQKLHHCMMDGEGARKLGEVMNDFEPDATPRPVDDAISKAQPGQIPSRWQQSFNLARRYSGLPLQASREIYGAVAPRMLQRISRAGRSDKKLKTPIAHFNGHISGNRGLVFGSLSLPAIKQVKNHFDVTVNDAILAIVSGSLRDYLLQEGKLPDDSLRTAIAVSLRQEGDDEFSNKITSASVTLATALTDPAERLRAIAEESNTAKQKARGGGRGIMEMLQLMPPLLVNAMVNFAPPDKSVSMNGMNLLVSNVRGSPWPMYMAGAKVTATYPISILAPGMGINVTCMSYIDQVDVGITVEPAMFPDPWRLVDGMQATLKEYLSLTGKKPPRRGQKAARGKKSTAPKRNQKGKRSS